MFAQLLGMGRKKEKEKDSSKDGSQGSSSVMAAADGKRREKEKDGEEHQQGVAAAADGALSPGKTCHHLPALQTRDRSTRAKVSRFQPPVSAGDFENAQRYLV